MGNGIREDAPLLRETSKNPEIRESRNPENPEIRKSGNPEIRKSGNPEIRKSGRKTYLRYTRKTGNGIREDAPLLRETSKNPGIQKSGKSGNPEIRKSGNPEINLELAETHFRYTTIIGLCQKSAINLPELYQNYDINMP